MPSGSKQQRLPLAASPRTAAQRTFWDSSTRLRRAPRSPSDQQKATAPTSSPIGPLICSGEILSGSTVYGVHPRRARSSMLAPLFDPTCSRMHWRGLSSRGSPPSIVSSAVFSNSPPKDVRALPRCDRYSLTATRHSRLRKVTSKPCSSRSCAKQGCHLPFASTESRSPATLFTWMPRTQSCRSSWKAMALESTRPAIRSSVIDGDRTCWLSRGGFRCGSLGDGFVDRRTAS